MASSLEDETTHFITCNVCLCEFDQAIRIPKCLPCAHTFCILCLEKIRCRHAIKCPLCQVVSPCSSTAAHLPNSQMALHMVKLKQKKENTKETWISLNHTRWCLTCGLSVYLACVNGKHACVDLKKVPMENLRDLLIIEGELRDAKSERLPKLAMAIEERTKIKTFLSNISTTLKWFEKEITTLEEENNAHLGEMMSLVEHQPSKQESSLNDLISLMENSNLGVSNIIAIREKMDKLVLGGPVEHKLFSSLRQSSQIEQLFREEDFVDDRRFAVNWPETKASVLLTNGQVSLLSRLSASLNNRAVHHDPINESANKASRSLPSVVLLPLGKIPFFTLRHFKSHRLLMGEITINPSAAASPYSDFIQRLGSYFKQSSLNNKLVSLQVGKVVPGYYVLLPFVSPSSLYLPHIPHLNPTEQHLAKAVGDVGVTCLTSDDNVRVSSWMLIFPLENYGTLTSHHFIPSPVILLGRVSDPKMIIRKMVPCASKCDFFEFQSSFNSYNDQFQVKFALKLITIQRMNPACYLYLD